MKKRRQLTLFATNGDEAKRRGIARALAHVNAEYRREFIAAVISLPAGTRLTSETILKMVGLPPGHHSAVGGLMYACARRGLIVPDDEDKPTQVKATRVRSHSALIGLWIRTHVEQPYTQEEHKNVG